MIKFNKVSGFTLVELLIVISLIGVLATILITVLDPLAQRRKGVEAKAQSELARVAQAVEAYGVEYGDYNADHDGDGVAGDCTTSVEDAEYLKQWPLPADNDITYCVPTCNAGDFLARAEVDVGGEITSFVYDSGGNARVEKETTGTECTSGL